MYRYDAYDRTLVAERARQFRDQVRRRLAGEIDEERFRPLRLTNGLYLQLHAYMLRVAIPYGTLSVPQVRVLAAIARRYDRGFGHFTTRQNIQYNWIRLEDVPDILDMLAQVEMHGIQTSGNCIRNVTADHLAGVAPDEIEDPRLWCEIVRQWSTLHPEFSFLPRKFKIAVTGAPNDRAAVRVHDIGLRMHRDDRGRIGFEVLVGGGLGRTPMIAKTIRPFLPKEDLLSYLEAILRVYNAYGRRDNMYKARIKILVHEIGVAEMSARVEAEWQAIRDGALKLDAAAIADIEGRFVAPRLESLPAVDFGFEAAKRRDPAFARFARTNVLAHRAPGYAAVQVSMKPPGAPPGDASADQLDGLADLAEWFGAGELRVTHEQNVLLPHVRLSDVEAVWTALVRLGLATPNVGLISDVVACPGLDYCSLASARSIPVAQRIAERFADPARALDVGELRIKISGCINACGHHHVGHIGILGLEKNGEEFYQVTLGGSPGEDAALGAIVGPAVAAAEIADFIERLVETYRNLRRPGERFVDTYRRVGAQPFKETAYAAA